ncbi:MAG TPA: protein translocase subunit SecF [Streptosporangiaceae bacterium]|jgi:preprotein translocase subunit SecF
MSRIGNIGGRLYRGEISVEFVGRRRLWYIISGLILVISLGALIGRGLNYSVDFKGGSVFQFKAAATSQSQIRSVVSGAEPGATITVQQVGVGGSTSWQVQTEKLSFADQTRIQDALGSKLHVNGGAKAVSTTFVGPSWGSQISQKAFQALIAFLIVIVIYLSIAFEWKMATAALVALIHDIVITIGVYALAGFQVSPATVIGLLTILGYSLYDTVVVFDKVRENTAGLLGTGRSTYSQSANLALNQTLVRSINTSLIALLPVVAILVTGITLLGPGELEDLALVLFVGMLSGTYSSICIATPVLAQLKEREPQYKALAKRVALRASGGRAAQRARTKAAQAGGRAAGPAGQQDQDGPDEDLAAGGETPAGQGTGDRVPAARGAGASAAPRGGARPGPRQQPRRSGSAKRRPAGKKKRR